MLGLLVDTDPAWVAVAEGNLGALLSDHAHCELKAAQSALSLVAKYGGDMPELVEPLTALAQEEAAHFGQVHERLVLHQALLTAPSSDEYVQQLLGASRADRVGGGGPYPVLLDRLLISALIEARSCERFRILSEQLNSADLRAFYRELMASEARHFSLFSGLAEKRFGRQDMRARFSMLAEREADIVRRLPLSAAVHG